MPRIEHLYDRPKKRRFSFLALAVLVAMSSVSSYFVFQPKPAAALSTRGPDPNDFGGGAMAFVVDNTSYVGIFKTSFRVYYSGKASKA